MAEESRYGRGGELGKTVERRSQNEFEAPQCKAETVVVYMDRAEVCRSFKANVVKGENEILLKKLSPCIDKDSVRVEGRGAASISEVSFLSKHVSPEEESTLNRKQKMLETQLEDAQRKRSVLQAKQHRLSKQRDVLDGFADSITKAGGDTNNDKNDKHQHPLDPNILQGISGFFDLYDKQATRLDDGLHELEIELEKVDAHINAVSKNLGQVGSAKDKEETRELSILLDATEDGEVEFYISYVVSKAKWSPKYDIRVFSNERQMKILYFGMIQQATGEDWDDTKLCLSTAMPSVGGIVPDLGTQRLGFKQKPMYLRKRKGKGLMLGRSASMRSKDNYRGLDIERADFMPSSALALHDVALEECSIAEESLLEMETPVAEVKESVTTTMYEIARRSTIPCDNASHKVSVAIIDLEPTFEYESVPKKASHVYLKAKVKNTSPYALLAGPTNIFLDNNFIAKAELKAVSPSEDFTCSLGADPAVRIDYKPVHKYREQSGLISKNTSITYKQMMEIKNTHKEAIKITVTDQLPLSTEEKIKVTLVEPAIKHPEKYDKTKSPRINKQNNVEWELEVAPAETKEIVMKYTVEYPVTEEVETAVIHASESHC